MADQCGVLWHLLREDFHGCDADFKYSCNDSRCSVFHNFFSTPRYAEAADASEAFYLPYAWRLAEWTTGGRVAQPPRPGTEFEDMGGAEGFNATINESVI
jgi:hypothetical protein